MWRKVKHFMDARMEWQVLTIPQESQDCFMNEDMGKDRTLHGCLNAMADLLWFLVCERPRR